MINRLGNLTLLGKRLNTSIKNADFDSKKNAYGTSDILLTQELVEIDTWDALAVDNRQRELSTYAFDIWHMPSEERPSLLGDNPETDGATTEATSQGEQTSVNLEQLPEVPTS